MKYLALLVVVAIIGIVMARQSPVASVQDAVKQSQIETAPLAAGSPASAPATTSLRQPIDRTKEVLNQVKARNGTGEF